MIDRLEWLGSRLLSRMVPTITASAASCRLVEQCTNINCRLIPLRYWRVLFECCTVAPGVGRCRRLNQQCGGCQ
jgi:hypothetical protein